MVVELRLGYHLSPDQVQGIVNLVASSVPKLSVEKVTVIDSSGRPLKEIIPPVAGTEAEKLNALKLKHEQEIDGASKPCSIQCSDLAKSWFALMCRSTRKKPR